MQDFEDGIYSNVIVIMKSAALLFNYIKLNYKKINYGEDGKIVFTAFSSPVKEEKKKKDSDTKKRRLDTVEQKAKNYSPIWLELSSKSTKITSFFFSPLSSSHLFLLLTSFFFSPLSSSHLNFVINYWDGNLE